MTGKESSIGPWLKENRISYLGEVGDGMCYTNGDKTVLIFEIYNKRVGYRELNSSHGGVRIEKQKFVHVGLGTLRTKIMAALEKLLLNQR